jgi:hypothetical protein
MSDFETPTPINAQFVSERGRWQRTAIIMLLVVNAIIGLLGLNETNENETRSRDGRPLLCGLAFDDAISDASVAAVYEQAGCPEVFIPLPER